jgi:DNA-binding protein HU-beta
MNANDLVEAVADQAQITKVAAKHALSVITDEITAAVRVGQKVTIAGFGVFEKSARSARVGRNPQTGEKIKIKAALCPKFRPGKAFKDAVRKFKEGAPAKKAKKRKSRKAR